MRTNNQIRFEKLYAEDDVIEIQVSASSGEYQATAHEYTGRSVLVAFGGRLQEFPRCPSDEVVLEIGVESDSRYSYAKLRPYLFHPKSHAAMKVKMRSVGRPPYRAMAGF